MKQDQRVEAEPLFEDQEALSYLKEQLYTQTKTPMLYMLIQSDFILVSKLQTLA